MSDCLNYETLAALRRIEKTGQLVFTAKLVKAYLEDTEKRIKEIRNADQSGNHVLLAKLAHAIKGTSLNVGADGLSALMKTIEGEAEKGALCGPERLSLIEERFSQVREAFAAYLA